jgi:ATP-binding cassette, subfamily G (WHITE), member 2, PDR
MRRLSSRKRPRAWIPSSQTWMKPRGWVRRSAPSSPSWPISSPFLDPETDPELNPTSTKFNARKWVKNFLRFVSLDPDRYPRRTAGVSFRNLNVYGFGTAADYQMDVANAWLKAAGWFRSLVVRREKIRIDILRDFEGLVRSGEMLVVLGRPGRYVCIRVRNSRRVGELMGILHASGCSTLLRTLARETHGIWLDQEALSYRY